MFAPFPKIGALKNQSMSKLRKALFNEDSHNPAKQQTPPLYVRNGV